MRIIAGSSGGIPIRVPRETTRPTTDRVRESVFSSLGTLVERARVLDLYAGSGSLGLESLSRGAACACFVDDSRAVCEVIRQNLRRARLEDLAEVRCLRVERFLAAAGQIRFDLIFADPPYARSETEREALEHFLRHESLPGALESGGLLVLESDARSPLPEVPSLRKVREKRYGDTRITFFSPADRVTAEASEG